MSTHTPKTGMAANKNQLFILYSFVRLFHIILVLFYVPRKRPLELPACLVVIRDDDAPVRLQSVLQSLEIQFYRQERVQRLLRQRLPRHQGMYVLALRLREPVENKGIVKC